MTPLGATGRVPKSYVKIQRLPEQLLPRKSLSGGSDCGFGDRLRFDCGATLNGVARACCPWILCVALRCPEVSAPPVLYACYLRPGYTRGIKLRCCSIR